MVGMMNSEQKWVGAELSATNAGDLLETARAAFATEKYGVASALAVLSAEESAKAFGLALHALAPDAELRPISSYFKSHREKHSAAAALTLGARAAEAVREYVQSIEDDESIPESDKGRIALERLLAASKRPLDQDEPPSILRDMKDIDEWHRVADTNKQAGFYVAFNQGQWHTPASVSRELAERNIAFADEAHVNVLALCTRELREAMADAINRHLSSARS